jgi:hypothetical protein
MPFIFIAQEGTPLEDLVGRALWILKELRADPAYDLTIECENPRGCPRLTVSQTFHRLTTQSPPRPPAEPLITRSHILAEGPRSRVVRRGREAILELAREGRPFKLKVLRVAPQIWEAEVRS